MLKQRIEKELGIAYEDKLLIYDKSGFSDAYDYPRLLRDRGFQIYTYNGIEEFRLVYEQDIRYAGSKCAVIVTLPTCISPMTSRMLSSRSNCPMRSCSRDLTRIH